MKLLHLQHCAHTSTSINSKCSELQLKLGMTYRSDIHGWLAALPMFIACRQGHLPDLLDDATHSSRIMTAACCRATGAPPFVIGFVLTPLASNSSELVSSLTFAARKKRKNMSLTLSQVCAACSISLRVSGQLPAAHMVLCAESGYLQHIQL